MPRPFLDYPAEPFMRLFRSLFALVAIVATTARSGLAQSGATDLRAPIAPLRQVHFDLSLAGLNVGFALRNTARTSVGASIGIGGNWWNYMVLSGSHFSEEGGLSYQSKDGSTDKSLFELFRGTIFVRTHFDAGRHLDLGLKASGFLHSDSSDDDPGGGTFIGLNATAVWWQWRLLRVASELDAGRYSEGRPEFGVNVAPVLLRVTIP
jgi:hypothetical protein